MQWITITAADTVAPVAPLADWSIDGLLPEFGTLAIRDDHGPEVPVLPEEQLLELWALEGVPGSVPITETGLADLLVADPDDVREALDLAVRGGRIRVDGDRRDPFRMAAAAPDDEG